MRKPYENPFHEPYPLQVHSLTDVVHRLSKLEKSVARLNSLLERLIYELGDVATGPANVINTVALNQTETPDS